MACLNPIHIHNTAKYFGNSASPFDLAVPCGECSECKKAMQNEYYFRAAYQCEETLNCHGFVYFDTLTYAENHLPHIADFVPELDKRSMLNHSCFNLDHYRKFFVRLRRKLDYYGYDAKQVKYFMCSEYGTDETKTHRPHYHILFFCTDPKLDSLILSDFVADCWPYGRTDGKPYKGVTYVMNHTFDERKDRAYMRNVCNYVAKYVTKNSSFDSTIESRIKLLVQRLCPKDPKEFRRRLKRNMCEFHRQSQGFGIYGLKYNDVNEVYSTGMLKLADSEHIVTHIPLPMYFQRKMFYDLTHDKLGNKCWRLNEKGVQYRLDRLDDTIDRAAVKYAEWFANLDNTITVGDIYPEYNSNPMTESLSVEIQDSLKDAAVKWLDGRSWNEFAEYVLVYKGRIKTNKMIETNEKEEKHEFYKKALTRSDSVADAYFNYTTPKDKKNFGTIFLSKVPCETRDDFRRASDRGLVISHGAFMEQYVITDKTFPEYHDFDRLYKAYLDGIYFTQIRKTKQFNAKENFVQVFNKYKS